MILSLSFYFFLTLSRDILSLIPKIFCTLFVSCFRVLLATYDAKSTVFLPNSR